MGFQRCLYTLVKWTDKILLTMKEDSCKSNSTEQTLSNSALGKGRDVEQTPTRYQTNVIRYPVCSTLTFSTPIFSCSFINRSLNRKITSFMQTEIEVEVAVALTRS